MSDSSSTPIFSLENRYSNIFKNTLPFVVVVLALVFSFPTTSQAGVLSSIGNILGISNASAGTVPTLSRLPDNIFDSRIDSKQLLHSAVNINPNPNKEEVAMIVVSGSALLSESGPAGTALDVENEPSNTQISRYTVRKGDNLESIAKMFDVSVNTLLWANSISSAEDLQEGQNLIILPISGVRYVVKKGDTLSSISARYKADAADLMKYNNINDKTVLIPGRELVIPDVELSTVANNSATNISDSLSGYVKGSNAPLYPGYYIRPIKGGIKSQGLHGYNAIDLADDIGTPIYAAAKGTVILVNMGGWHGGYGNYIVLSHGNGTQTLYAHLLKGLVSVGDVVEQGQQIALMGSTGKSTGPHVHFEIRGGKMPTDF